MENLVYDGLWFTTIREALDAFVDKTQETVTGTVKLKLYKGNIMVAGKESPNMLFMMKVYLLLVQVNLYDHKDAEGFINLFVITKQN